MIYQILYYLIHISINIQPGPSKEARHHRVNKASQRLLHSGGLKFRGFSSWNLKRNETLRIVLVFYFLSEIFVAARTLRLERLTDNFLFWVVNVLKLLAALVAPVLPKLFH